MSVYNINKTKLNKIYDVKNTRLTDAYDILTHLVYDYNSGDVPEKIEVDYNNYTYGSYSTKTFSYTIQGFAVYDGKIFQLSSGNENNLVIFDANNIEDSHTVSIKGDHGDSASFSNEFVDPNDEYPLLYITADTNPCLIYANRIKPDYTTELIKTYSFPLDKTGYYAALSADFENEIMYTVGYAIENYSSNPGNNATVISAWDMSQVTENQDGTLTPDFIKTFQLNFMPVQQGLDFHDGLIWISSTNYSNNWIYAVDPDNEEIAYTITLADRGEFEGICFISDTELVYTLWGGPHKKITFAERESN